MPIQTLAPQAPVAPVRSAPVAPTPALKAERDARFDRELAAAGPDAYIKSSGYSAIQQHGAFFDTNFDHRVSLTEVEQGLQDLGLGPTSAKALAPVITGGLGALTHPSPNQRFLDKLKNTFTINLDALGASLPKGGNGAFDAAGNLDQARFEHMLSFDKTKSGSLSKSELDAMIDADQQDKLGKIRTKAGFSQLLSVAADTQKTELVKGMPQTVPALSRERLLSFYDGTIFYRVAAEQGHPHPLVAPKQ